jgi:hypothetical protein
MHEAHEVAPRNMMPDQGDGSPANRRPDSAQQRFEADALFIDGPQLDPCQWKGGCDRP